MNQIAKKKTLRLVAEYGDACNWRLGTLLSEFTQEHKELYQDRSERLGNKIAKLKEHCARIGRNPEEIERTVFSPIRIAKDGMSVTELVELCRQLAEIGIHHYVFSMSNVHEIEPIELIGREVILQVVDLSPLTTEPHYD